MRFFSISFPFQSAAITNKNSTSCWRWPNPDTSAEIWVHHIVTSVITVTCCRNLPGFPCCGDLYSEYCICEDIVDSQTFDTCSGFHHSSTTSTTPTTSTTSATSLTSTLGPSLRTFISSEDLDENGTKIYVSQEFIYDRDNGGSMRIEVEAHMNYEKATMMMNDTHVY